MLLRTPLRPQTATPLFSCNSEFLSKNSRGGWGPPLAKPPRTRHSPLLTPKARTRRTPQAHLREPTSKFLAYMLFTNHYLGAPHPSRTTLAGTCGDSSLFTDHGSRITEHESRLTTRPAIPWSSASVPTLFWHACGGSSLSTDHGTRITVHELRRFCVPGFFHESPLTNHESRITASQVQYCFTLSAVLAAHRKNASACHSERSEESAFGEVSNFASRRL
jgi:hypothetical protein